MLKAVVFISTERVSVISVTDVTVQVGSSL